ncbi:MAG: V-type ATP synthase subunit E [Candidatus Omnitrophica bacterium]|nr:V-type ATP synthase subunit E [Candidatus Omnitrophota bacterium]MDE2222856.1 V-type ATP synthase subunit E [Candidatus Omnitrophota bacterium]
MKIQPIPSGSIEGLCTQISKDALDDARRIFAQARDEIRKITEEGAKESEAMCRRIEESAQKEVKSCRQKIMGAVNLEVRRTILGAREEVFGQIMAAVKAKAADYRRSGEYPQYLKTKIIEGLLVLQADCVEILGGSIEKSILNDDFLAGIEQEFKEKHGLGVTLEFKTRMDWNEMGFILRSRDGRLLFDNTFSAHLARHYEEIRSTVLKELYGKSL